jgi:hypothetical protein
MNAGPNRFGVLARAFRSGACWPERGVTAAGIVEAFDVVEDRHPGFGEVAPAAAIDELALEAGEEAAAVPIRL